MTIKTIVWWVGHLVLLLIVGAMLQEFGQEMQFMAEQSRTVSSSPHFSFSFALVVIEVVLALLSFLVGHLLIKKMLNKS